MKFMEFDELAIGASRVAFGYFDGMHLGHRAVIDKLVGYEAQVPVVLSFSDVVNPVIYTEDEKKYLLEKMGIEVMVSVHAERMEELTAEEFVKDVIVGKLHAGSVVCGENLAFGSDKADAEALKAFGAELGFEVEVVPTVKINDEPVSTEAVKTALETGDFDKMQELMGHTYVMYGYVAHGKAEGRQHGMPTANLKCPANKLFPPHGVYATLSHFDGTFFRGMTNIGLRPSADTIPVATIETWLINFKRYIYGKEILLECYKYIRPVMKFNGLDEVRAQIDRDLTDINDYMDALVKSLKK